MRLYNLKPGGKLHIESELREGKGYASSSADMVVTARAIESAFEICIPGHSLARIMSAIEPSDGVMYEGIVSFHQREGIVHGRLGTLPSLTIVALDEGGRAETTEVCKDRGFHNASRLAEYERLLLELGRAVKRRHLPSVGNVATRSAVLNQDVLPKEHLELFLDLRARYDALGVVATHSGTCLGLLFDPGSLHHPDVLPQLVGELLAHDRAGVHVYHTCGLMRSLQNATFTPTCNGNPMRLTIHGQPMPQLRTGLVPGGPDSTACEERG